MDGWYHDIHIFPLWDILFMPTAVCHVLKKPFPQHISDGFPANFNICQSPGMGNIQLNEIGNFIMRFCARRYVCWSPHIRHLVRYPGVPIFSSSFKAVRYLQTSSLFEACAFSTWAYATVSSSGVNMAYMLPGQMEEEAWPDPQPLPLVSK